MSARSGLGIPQLARAVSDALSRNFRDVEVETSVANGKLMVAQVDVSNGHSGKRGPELHFGLGKLSGPATVPVDLCWRDVDGVIHRETFNLTPGLHTLLLGSGSFRAN